MTYHTLFLTIIKSIKLSWYLSSNKIRRIRGLDTLIGLQKLWLDGNLIEHVGGLTNLSNLSELNLASNLIETIGVGLDSL